MEDYEKLGAFYLGRGHDLAAKTSQGSLLLYDLKDLTTHAVCVGMTGSGKTGLCLALLEEAAIDGIPAIAIDPKGDIADLLLTFPGLAGEDFAPWVNPEDAARKGVSVEDYAKSQAELWRKGLADWGQDSARVKRLRDAVDLAIYTPGSSAGIPVSILKSFAVPEQAVLEDGELCASGSARRSRASWVSSRSTPTRSRAASTSSSRRSSTRPGARERTSTFPRSSRASRPHPWPRSGFSTSNPSIPRRIDSRWSWRSTI